MLFTLSKRLVFCVLVVFALSCGTSVGEQGSQCYLHDTAHCARQTLCNGELCSDVCIPGTVKIDPWVVYALESQRLLSYDEPFIVTQVPATHNSAISLAYGIGIEAPALGELIKFTYPNECLVVIADQFYSITDQLNMGIRMLELDIHWYNGAVRICHWTVPPSNFLSLVNDTCDELNVSIFWDPSRLGCWNQSRPLADVFGEVLEWLVSQPAARRPVLQLYLDNRVDEAHLPDLLALIEANFSSRVFTPADLAANYSGQWPTYAELVAANKTFIITNLNEEFSNSTIGDDYWFSPPYWLADQFDPNYFAQYPACTFNDTFYYGSNFTRPIDHRLVLGPYDSERPGGLIDKHKLSEMLACGVTYASIDNASPDFAKHFVWSWEYNQPGSTQHGDNCVAMGLHGRWSTVHCEATLHYACQAGEDPATWLVSPSSGPWAEGAEACPTGFTFGVPKNGYANSALHAVAQKAGKKVWINYLAMPLF